MGIRIRKMLGYGLTDVIKDDPRINWDSKIFEYEMDGRTNLEQYVEFCDRIGKDYELSGIDKMMIKAQHAALDAGEKISYRELYSIQDSFNWGTEDGGLQNVLCIKPVTVTDWYRFDDIMDYIEENEIHSPSGIADRVNVLDHGIHPYSGAYMDKRSGERIKGHDIMTWIRVWTNLSEDEKAKISAEVVSALGALTAPFGMTHEEAAENVVPLVPDEVRNVCDFVGIFKDNEAWKQLRPMIYTWWS